MTISVRHGDGNDIHSLRSRPVALDWDEAVSRTLRIIESAVIPHDPVDPEAFAYIPYGLVDFRDGLERCAEATEGRRFLDVGCGLGRTLILAHHLGWDAAGIEFHPPYADIARQLAPSKAVECVNAFDFDDWSDYDAVYVYRPIVSVRRMMDLTKQIVAGMKPGALLWVPTPNRAGEPEGCERVGDDLWRVC